jgi:hypothetical protein
VVVDCLANKVVEPVHGIIIGQRKYEADVDTTLTPSGTQYGETWGEYRKKDPLGIGDLQGCANLSNARIITC